MTKLESFSQFCEGALKKKKKNNFYGINEELAIDIPPTGTEDSYRLKCLLIPSTCGHKNCCSLWSSVFFEVKDDNSDDDNEDSGNITIIDCQKSHTV